MFAKYVNEETVIAAGFNYWEPSYCFREGNKWCRVYHSYLSGENIVIVEAIRQSGEGRARRDWHFCTFEGPDFVEKDQEEVQRNIRITLQRKHRVVGRDLESGIRSLIELSHS